MEQVTALVNNDATVHPINVYEVKARNAKARNAKARNAKAAKLADLLLLHGASSAEAAALPAESRRTVAALAGVRPPSTMTWELVCEFIACVERARARTPLVERLEDD